MNIGLKPMTDYDRGREDALLQYAKDSRTIRARAIADERDRFTAWLSTVLFMHDLPAEAEKALERGWWR